MSFPDPKAILSAFFVISQILSWIIHTAGEFCEAYVDESGTYHTSSHCPGPDAIGEALNNIYCCGDATYKYCCSEPQGYFLEHFNIGAFVGGSIAIVIAVIIGIILCCCCCSCCCYKQKQTRRRSLRANGPGQSAVAYNGPRSAVNATPMVQEISRPNPPQAVPKSYPKQQYSTQMGVAPSPHHSPHHHPSPQHHHATPPIPHQHHHNQPYAPPPMSAAPPVVNTSGAAGYPSSPHHHHHHHHHSSPHHIGFSHMEDQPPPYISPAPPVQMQAPPLMDKGGYHVQGGAGGGPSAPPVTQTPPPATNPHYHGNM